MKDAKGHGSDAKGGGVAHQIGVNKALQADDRETIRNKIKSLEMSIARIGDSYLQGVMRQDIRSLQIRLKELG